MRFMPVALFFASGACAQIAIQVAGQPVGTRSTLNFMNGAGGTVSGIIQVCNDNRPANRVDCSSSYNTAFISTHDTVHDNENYCNSSNGTTGYTCRLPFKALNNYQPGMTFLLNADTGCVASCTLNIDNAGVVSIKKADGATDPGGAIGAGQPQWIFYDGKVFRLVAGSGAGSASVATPSSYSGPTDQRGDVIARRVIGAMETPAYGPAINLDVTAGDLHKIRTTNGGGNAIINASTAGLPGQHMWIIVANDQFSAKTIAFGANFRSAGGLVGAVGKTATIQFISDGAAWYEVGRTQNL